MGYSPVGHKESDDWATSTSMSESREERERVCRHLCLSLLFKNVCLVLFLAASCVRCDVQDLSLAHGLSSRGAQALVLPGSGVVVLGLSCPAARGILVLQPRMKPTSPTLADGVLTTGLPGKSLSQIRYFVGVSLFLLYRLCQSL